MSKKSDFRGPFDKQHRRRAQALLKSASQHLHHMLVNTLAADKKYPALNRQNLTISIQMYFYQKQNTLFQVSAAFLKSQLNFEYFEKKDDPHRFYISQITDSENVVR